jgi:hypothetical protein
LKFIDRKNNSLHHMFVGLAQLSYRLTPVFALLLDLN